MSSAVAIGEIDGRACSESSELFLDNKYGQEFPGQSASTAGLRRSFARSVTHPAQALPVGRDFVYPVVKRGLDIVISLVALVVLSPLFLVVALAVKLHDRGPVFFSQSRVGGRGRTFKCWKFRSMVADAEALRQELAAKSDHDDPRTFKMANDPRITPVGRMLRRFSIDEFPQIFNVLIGDMSIVGPRPPLPDEVALYTDTDYQRLAVKPGLTCIWQVSGRSRLPFPEQVRMDVDYIRRKGILLDLTIILRTVPAVISGDGAK
jgi:lipopolysaccharide/colanic/teichoic acid biosynthesis glycosyltransferase